MKIARVITTLACGRSCEYCCNKYETLTQLRKKIREISEVWDYDQILLTGGEPMLQPKRIIEICQKLRDSRYPGKIYMYSAKWTTELWDVLEYLDGIHFTLHTASQDDVSDFMNFQNMIRCFPEKSFRCYISPSIAAPIRIYPNLWTRLEIKPWIPEGKCPLPSNEELFILEEQPCSQR